MFLDRIACDFPDLKMIGAHTGWPWVDELLSVCYKWENIWFGVDAWAPKYLSPQIIQFINSRMGRDRCVWGTNGLPWKESLKQLCDLGLKEEVQRKLLRENAVQLFKLEEPSRLPAGNPSELSVQLEKGGGNGQTNIGDYSALADSHAGDAVRGQG
jgi:predicted TIM-barrel fold metal-dependent hydrolase